MTPYPILKPGSTTPITELPPLAADITWAGSGGRYGTFCYGTTDGRLLFADSFGRPKGHIDQAVNSGEAVNGVAFLPGFVGVSSRADGMIWRPMGFKRDHQEVSGGVFPFGLHGITAGRNFFVAPAGRAGLVFCTPTSGEAQTVETLHSDDAQAYYYRTATFSTIAGELVAVNALRKWGLGYCIYKAGSEGSVLHSMTTNGIDVVDVCVGGDPHDPAPVVALCSDCTLLLSRNIIERQSPVVFKYNQFKGVAYRALVAGGFVFLLTSRALYVIDDLFAPASSGRTHNATTLVRSIPMDAIDISVVDNRWLLALLPHRVLRIDISRLKATQPKGQEADQGRYESIRLTPEFRYANNAAGSRVRDIIESRTQFAVAIAG